MNKETIFVLNAISITIYVVIGIAVLVNEYSSISEQLSWYFGFILFGFLYFGLIESLCFILYKPRKSR